jgi:hypothetical protein
MYFYWMKSGSILELTTALLLACWPSSALRTNKLFRLHLFAADCLRRNALIYHSATNLAGVHEGFLVLRWTMRNSSWIIRCVQLARYRELYSTHRNSCSVGLGDTGWKPSEVVFSWSANIEHFEIRRHCEPRQSTIRWVVPARGRGRASNLT